MKVWTYLELRTQVIKDTDQQDETFVLPETLIGYCNEALQEAQSEIIVMNQDYFLTNKAVPTINGQAAYALPANIYASKIRGVTFRSGAIGYTIHRYRPRYEFQEIDEVAYMGQSLDYRYYLQNDQPGNSLFMMSPPARETSTVYPKTPLFQPVIMWYLRDIQRVPVLGEFCNPEDFLAPAVDPVGDTITLANTYVVGDKIKFSTIQGTLPAPLVAGTTYFISNVAGKVVKLATTLANAQAGTSIDLTTTGTDIMTAYIGANQGVIDATPIDIPEFASFIMQWMKVKCMSKDKDPSYEDEVANLQEQRKMLVDTLTEMIVDNDTCIEGDFSFYQEMS